MKDNFSDPLVYDVYGEIVWSYTLTSVGHTQENLPDMAKEWMDMHLATLDYSDLLRHARQTQTYMIIFSCFWDKPIAFHGPDGELLPLFIHSNSTTEEWCRGQPQFYPERLVSWHHKAGVIFFTAGAFPWLWQEHRLNSELMYVFQQLGGSHKLAVQLHNAIDYKRIHRPFLWRKKLLEHSIDDHIHLTLNHIATFAIEVHPKFLLQLIRYHHVGRQYRLGCYLRWKHLFYYIITNRAIMAALPKNMIIDEVNANYIDIMSSPVAIRQARQHMHNLAKRCYMTLLLILAYPRATEDTATVVPVDIRRLFYSYYIQALGGIMDDGMVSRHPLRLDIDFSQLWTVHASKFPARSRAFVRSKSLSWCTYGHTVPPSKHDEALGHALLHFGDSPPYDCPLDNMWHGIVNDTDIHFRTPWKLAIDGRECMRTDLRLLGITTSDWARVRKRFVWKVSDLLPKKLKQYFAHDCRPNHPWCSLCQSIIDNIAVGTWTTVRLATKADEKHVLTRATRYFEVQNSASGLRNYRIRIPYNCLLHVPYGIVNHITRCIDQWDKLFEYDPPSPHPISEAAARAVRKRLRSRSKDDGLIVLYTKRKVGQKRSKGDQAIPMEVEK